MGLISFGLIYIDLVASYRVLGLKFFLYLCVCSEGEMGKKFSSEYLKNLFRHERFLLRYFRLCYRSAIMN